MHNKPTVRRGFSALQRAEIAEIVGDRLWFAQRPDVSVLFNEPKLLKSAPTPLVLEVITGVSVLFNEPKLLKSAAILGPAVIGISFSALQRAEIAEIR